MSGDIPKPQPEAPAEEAAPARPLLEEVLRPLAIAGMLTCIAIALGQFLSALAPTFPAQVLVVLAFVVSLESIHSHRLLARRGASSEGRFRFHFVEWVIILVVTRLSAYASLGSARLLADVDAWARDLTVLFDATFVVLAVLMVLFWSLARLLSQAIQELEASPLERLPAVTDPGHYLRSTMPRHGRTDRQAVLNRIVTVFFWGGVLLLILSGLARVQVSELIALRHGRTSGVILNALLYFVIGLLVVSEAQYTILRADWELQSIPVLGRLGRRWLLLVIALLATVALLATLLPVSYSVGLIDALHQVARWIVYVVVQVSLFVLFLISYLIGLLMQLLMGTPDAAQPSRPPPMAIPPPEAAEPTGAPWPWWGTLRSLLFWVVVLGIVGYSLYHFGAERWGALRSLSLARLWRWLRAQWQGLTRGTRLAVGRAGSALRARLAARLARRGQAPAPWRYLSLRRLSPRERVRYYYLSLLQRSERLGHGRPPSLTPYEYGRLLQRWLPEAAPEVEALSDAFVEARYSEHPISGEALAATTRAWRRLRATLVDLRRRLRAGPAEER